MSDIEYLVYKRQLREVGTGETGPQLIVDWEPLPNVFDSLEEAKRYVECSMDPSEYTAVKSVIHDYDSYDSTEYAWQYKDKKWELL